MKCTDIFWHNFLLLARLCIYSYSCNWLINTRLNKHVQSSVMSSSPDQNSFTYYMKWNVCEMEKAFDFWLVTLPSGWLPSRGWSCPQFFGACMLVRRDSQWDVSGVVAWHTFWLQVRSGPKTFDLSVLAAAIEWHRRKVTSFSIPVFLSLVFF